MRRVFFLLFMTIFVVGLQDSYGLFGKKKEETQTYAEESIFGGTSMTEFSTALTTLVNSLKEMSGSTTSVISSIDKSIKKNANNLKNIDISIVPVLKEPFNNVRYYAIWMSEALTSINKGIADLNKVKAPNTSKETDAKNQIEIGLKKTPVTAFALANLRCQIVALVRYIEARKSKISDAVQIQKALQSLVVVMGEHKKMFVSKKNGVTADASAFLEQYDTFDGISSEDNIVNVFKAQKSNIKDFCEVINLFIQFIKGLASYLGTENLNELRAVEQKCNESLKTGKTDAEE